MIFGIFALKLLLKRHKCASTKKGVKVSCIATEIELLPPRPKNK
ncbi:hypothetical protein CDSM653_02265 [Caldanaerobacter subterraneus subsp. pacificus DSM 12653]|uniref:Uncharacterized protein n=1 Tax=Caldanaerobacter subterraneus subsp. pacificus DSM 12653 TaxID=391606 RepID=A0A0F5PJ75_9THEO|nr:hypothetical protein CDSM653_02265 [Caldanaerobacter subterraneus subsp. pacificus DSM 12653]